MILKEKAQDLLYFLTATRLGSSSFRGSDWLVRVSATLIGCKNILDEMTALGTELLPHFKVPMIE